MYMQLWPGAINTTGPIGELNLSFLLGIIDSLCPTKRQHRGLAYNGCNYEYRNRNNQ